MVSPEIERRVRQEENPSIGLTLLIGTLQRGKKEVKIPFDDPDYPNGLEAILSLQQGKTLKVKILPKEESGRVGLYGLMDEKVYQLEFDGKSYAWELPYIPKEGTTRGRNLTESSFCHLIAIKDNYNLKLVK